jgi:hypothetical protein
MRRIWSPHEEETLIRLYPTQRRAEVMEALPGRNWRGILLKAGKLGIRRSLEVAYDVDYRRAQRAAAIRKYQERPELRQHLSRTTLEAYQRGTLRSPLAGMGNGQPPPPHEDLAWIFLEPLGFQRQYCVPSGQPGPPYKLDFGHPDLKIDIEIDGKQHRETRIQERDQGRDEHLSSLGWRVVRISNEAISSVLLETLSKRLPQ